MINIKRLKLFKLLSAPLYEDEFIFIPDCLGEYSPFLDPIHDDFGREFTICFLVDNQGRVAIFGNIKEINYVPYDILFNLNKYNQCIKLLFGICNRINLAQPIEDWPMLYKQIRQNHILKEYALGETSLKNIFLTLKKGQVFESLEKLVRLCLAYYLLCFKKEIILAHLKNWKKLKRYYQKKGVYVFVPHPRLRKIVKIFAPNTECDENISNLARTIGQKIPLSFSNVKDISIDYLIKLQAAQI